eukprot:scaffold281_cov156-Skeletonema_menzelii.AAC.7
MTTDGDGNSKQYKTTAVVPASITSIQNANWHGRIPIQLSIAPTSLSSPNKPRTIHRMVSRMTYLHIGLFDEIMYLYEYAPSSIMAGTRLGKQAVVVREEPPDSPPKQEQQDHESDINDKKRIKEDIERHQDEEITFQSNQTESSAPYNDNNKDQRSEQSTYLTSTNSSFPECWFEDEESGIPLRWQLFVGVLYDLMKGRLVVNNPGSPCNKFRNLPWKLRIHFTSYPTDQLLPLDIAVPPQQRVSENDESINTAKHNNASQQAQINTLIGRIYRNSLKQALFLQYGSSKVAMSITKNNHEKIWDAVLQTNYEAYHQVNTELQVGVMAQPINNKLSLTDDLTSTDEKYNKDLPQLVPVRVLLNDKPAIQKPTLPQKKAISECLKQRPTEILQDDAVMFVSPYTTLGDVLVSCLPDLFTIDDATDCHTHYSIQGVQPSLSTTIVDLWRSLCHPDHFLYVTVATQ